MTAKANPAVKFKALWTMISKSMTNGQPAGKLEMF